MKEKASFQLIDCQKLHAGFYALFDRSRADDFLAEYGRRGETAFSANLLGEGSHFRAYLLPAGSLRQNSGIVVSIAHSCQEPAERKRLKGWEEAMQKLSALGLPLIPPLVILKRMDLTAVASPFGEQGIQKIAAHWHPFAASLRQLQEDLARSHLLIDDILQVRVWQRIPFVCDLSDLKSL